LEGEHVTALCAATISANRTLGTQPFMLGTRDVAASLRADVQKHLDTQTDKICIDFSDLICSQSFIDEFLGMLILQYGPGVLDRIVLQNCNEDVKMTARFVVKVRSRDFVASKS
jgi:hypothetical protein